MNLNHQFKTNLVEPLGLAFEIITKLYFVK